MHKTKRHVNSGPVKLSNFQFQISNLVSCDPSLSWLGLALPSRVWFLAFPSWPSLLEVGGWLFPLVVGVWPFLLGVWDLALAGFFVVVVGPSFLPFLLAFSVRQSFLEWELALLGMGVGPSR